MNGGQDDGVSRRTFIKAGVTMAAAAGVGWEAWADQQQGEAAATPAPMPRRVIKRTGQEIPILAQGAGRPPTPRLLNAAYDAGIRCIDTGADYGNASSERVIGQWLTKTGRRKEICLITKDRPTTPDEWAGMVDRSLRQLQTDYIDVYLVHSLGGEGWLGTERGDCDIPTRKEWAAAADKLKKSGKVGCVGFTSHAEVPLRVALLNNAAAGSWVEAAMVSYDPKLVRDNADFSKALDACHKAGVGLICMKGMRAVDDIPKILPDFADLGLSSYQAVLHAIWTDERITTITSEMPNVPIIQENATAARNFQPLGPSKVAAVVGLYERYGRRFCNACDGRCRRAGGTRAALNDIVRALSYYERDGDREKGRALFASLAPERRDWRGADLAAASAACRCKLDFAALLRRAEEKLA